ncbi:efflux RND transporter permease subunit, partial [Escherichia coli]|uniref:efflux RND transporter permease subunit n=1 Tax=Escherichia coli TaxID=562 RepID=UPI003B428FCE
MEAAVIGAREIGFTVVSLTASLVAVFIPLLFASGMMGAFFREFTVTLVAAIVVSMVVSLTLTPALCSRFLSAHDHKAAPSRFGRWLDAGHERMLRIYTVFLDFSLR